jgi:hypothetical protein
VTCHFVLRYMDSEENIWLHIFGWDTCRVRVTC